MIYDLVYNFKLFAYQKLKKVIQWKPTKLTFFSKSRVINPEQKNQT